MPRSAMQKFLIMCLFFFGMRAFCGGEEPSWNPNVQLPTLGGMQFWGDELIFHQWRIQRNAIDGHYRLLDETDRRHAWGSFEQCRAVLEKIKREQNLPPMRGRAVIVLHGLGGSRMIMKSLERYLREKGKLQVFSVGYPSTQGSVGEHAKSLARLIDGLEGIDEIDFVAHSLGNIIIRHYLQDVKVREKNDKLHLAGSGTAALTPAASPVKEEGSKRKQPRFRRMVMLGPPNHGSTMALLVSEPKLLQTVGGKSAAELGRDWDHLQGKLAIPNFEFAIITGGKKDGRGYNPLMPGDDDGMVGVEDARLVGARDSAVVPVLHFFLPHDPHVQEQTLRFLEKGFLQSEQARQPIEQMR
jgi:pimeloyl-ACP methyl ester carboxylesterase